MNKGLEKIYYGSPPFFQNLGVSLYGLGLYFREYGREFKYQLGRLEQMQWYPADRLEDYQNQQLRTLIRHCYDNVPYYRKIMDDSKLQPADISTISDLPLLPILTREDIKRNFAGLTAHNIKRSQLYVGHTSGTTGSPLEFLYDRRICLMKNVVDWRQKHWGGVNFGDKIAFFLGRVVVPISQTKPPFWRANWVLNHLFFSSFHLSSGNMARYIEKLERFNPMAVEGYPSTAYIIARYLLSQKRIFPVKAVFTSSETLFPQQREIIEKAFACPVFDFYGLAERVAFASECNAHEGHHINTDFGVIEILNRNLQPVARGEIGRIVATGLHNYGMPLIRYQTSDVTSLKDRKCSCGREFPLMEDVTTKAEDIITTRDGRYISSSILTHPFKPMHNVAESQIIQEDRESIRVKIVKLPSYDDKDTLYLQEELKKRVGAGMKIDIEFVESIPRTPSGKFRWVISRVPLEF
jgi:phenylacetate-CoA ligase